MTISLGLNSSYFHSYNLLLTNSVNSPILSSCLAYLTTSFPIAPVASIKGIFTFLADYYSIKYKLK